MLEVKLKSVSYRTLENVSLTFPASTFTAIVGPPASGASTLLQLIAGEVRANAGEIQIGNRVVTSVRTSRRPLLYVTAEIEVPHRWSVRHALVAAVRHRTLDRVDRQHEHNLAVEKWKLAAILDRTLSTLSDSERTLVHLARIELSKPGILIADRLLERLNPSGSEEVIDTLYRTLRVAGTTVIAAPASRAELGATDRVIVLDNGGVAQEGTAAEIYAQPVSEAAALATGAINVIDITIDRTTVDSVIGSWEVSSPPFQGGGVALVRPEAFAIVPPGKESDLIVAVEEASFENGHWIVRAILSGAMSLRVSLPPETRLQKGKLLALTYNPSLFSLVRRARDGERHGTTFAPQSIVFDDNRHQR